MDITNTETETKYCIRGVDVYEKFDTEENAIKAIKKLGYGILEMFLWKLLY